MQQIEARMSACSISGPYSRLVKRMPTTDPRCIWDIWCCRSSGVTIQRGRCAAAEQPQRASYPRSSLGALGSRLYARGRRGFRLCRNCRRCAKAP